MPAHSSYAPGKIILFGEHAVVYGRPAIAAPVMGVRARAMVKADPRGAPGSVQVQAPDIGLSAALEELPKDHPLGTAVRSVLKALKIARPPAFTLQITSTIPVAAGLGSGAAVSVAAIRALSSFLGRPLPDEQVSSLAFEVEKLHHGTPSGIDNTVVTFGKPVYFVRQQPVEFLKVARPFTIVIGDTGIAAPTAETVGDVRKGWKKDHDGYEAMFESTGAIADAARQSIEIGMVENLGPLMNANHGLLRKLGVSSPALDTLVEAARQAGAMGAKLSGGGRGGNMIALVSPKRAQAVAAALEKAGAVHTLVTEVKDVPASALQEAG